MFFSDTVYNLPSNKSSLIKENKKPFYTCCGRMVEWEQHLNDEWNYVEDKMYPLTYQDGFIFRVKYLGLAILSPFAAGIDLIGGAMYLGLASFGAKSFAARGVMLIKDGSRKPVALFYLNVLKTLNPYAEFTGKEVINFDEKKSDPLCVREGNGLAAGSKRLKDLEEKAQKYRDAKLYFDKVQPENKSVWTNHVLSRLTYAGLAIGAVFARTVDAIIGVAAAVLSVLVLGNSSSLNNAAFRGLQATGVVGDLYYLTLKIINPWFDKGREIEDLKEEVKILEIINPWFDKGREIEEEVKTLNSEMKDFVEMNYDY